MGNDADVEALLHDLAPMFLAHHRDCLMDLHEAHKREDWSAIQAVAHTLKGSAATLGATALAATWAELYRMAATQNENDVTRCIERVTSSFEEVVDALAPYTAPPSKVID